MERWEEQLVRELQQEDRARANAAGPVDGDTPARDVLGEAFADVVARTTASVDRIAAATGREAAVVEEREAGRYQWTVGPRSLRLRLEREAQKFFVSTEAEAGLEMCELWVEDARLVTDAEGAPRAADPDAIVRRFVTLLFRGR